MTIKHINPDSLLKNPAFSQAVMVEDASRTLYIGGQNGLTAEGTLAGDEIGVQTEQALKNIMEILKSVDATQESVAKMTIFVVQGQNIGEGFAATQKAWGPHPTAMTVVVVSGLAVPGALVEIEAVCAL